MANLSYVACNETKPNGRTFYDWENEKIKNWLKNVIQLQEYHVKDNNKTEYFGFTYDDLDSLEMRILVALFGTRVPKDTNKGAPSSPLLTYTRDERKSIRHLKKKIIKYSSSDKILFNLIYVSTGMFAEDEVKKTKEFLASEVPVFVIKSKTNQRIYMDRDGRVYENFQDYKDNNKLEKATMLAPKDGTYTPDISNKKDTRVVLELCETPSTTLLKRIGVLADNVVSVAGVVLSVAGVVTFFAPGLLTATVASVISSGSFILQGYTLFNTLKSADDKTGHDESIRTELITLLSLGLNAYTGHLRSTATKFARDGKTYGEFLQKIGKFNEAFFKLANFITIVSSCSGILSSIYDLYQKRERTWQDYFQLSMSIFMLSNVLTKPKTLKGVFEAEQLTHIKQLKESLKSDEAKKQMTEMVDNHKSSDEKAYFIRNLNKIDNPTEFFELIGKTSSSVICTADGLSINNNIEISPQAYNVIGIAVFNEKLNQISKFNDVSKTVGLEYSSDIPSEKQAEFSEKLEKIKDLPASEQKEATKKLINEYKNSNSQSDETWNKKFDQTWDKHQNDLKKTTDKSLNDLIKHLSNGTSAEQADDFKELKSLAEKKINGTITKEEETKLNEQLDKCSKHRKEYFFSSSKGEYNTDEEKEQFKAKIKTFTSAQNERLCYRINVEEVKEKLVQLTGEQSFSEVESRNPLFKGMKTSDFDRINRVMDVYTKEGGQEYSKNLFKAAIKIAQDKDFAGAIKTPSDLTSITEALHLEKTEESRNSKLLSGDSKLPAQRTEAERNAINNAVNRAIQNEKAQGITNSKLESAANKEPGQRSPAEQNAYNKAINEAIKQEKEEMNIRRNNLISAANKEPNQRTEAETSAYNSFLNRFNEAVRQVDQLDPNIRSQWQSNVWMAYHWYKHRYDFSNNEITVDEYFKEYANRVFHRNNFDGPSFSQQSGDLKYSYSYKFGKKLHVGYTYGYGSKQKRASHFVN